MRGNENKGKSLKIILIVLYALFFCFLVLPIGIGAFVVMQEDTGFDVEYDYNPLRLKEVYVINRGREYQQHEVYEGYTLYEVILTYENEGWFTAASWNQPEFKRPEDGRRFYMMNAYMESDSDYRYDAQSLEPIPAGKEGSRRFWLEVEPGTRTMTITETGKRLSGKNQEVTVKLPGENGSTRVEVD